jgi:uncharacterized protein (TIGR02147 family)
MKTQKPLIYKYLCYRTFLFDYYQWQKKVTLRYSYRAMADTLGFTSPNFLKLVIDGERNISRESLAKITSGLGLSDKETEYFSYLVFFAQAKNGIDKNYYYGLLISLRSDIGISKIAPEQYEYFSAWYHPAIRELVSGKKAPLDYPALSDQLNRKVTVPQIKNSVALLLRLQLLHQNEHNVYEQTSSVINTDNEIRNFAIRNYHKSVMSVAQCALDEIPSTERENSHATIKISQKCFNTIKDKIQRFREEILQLAALDTNVDGVYHVNLQLYPITKQEEKNE